ncbi:MAG: hypothetical protein Alis3KO_16420 [Aliiglaciecola sp.]
MPGIPTGAGPITLNGAASGGGIFTGKSAVISAPIQLRENGRDLVVVVEDNLDVNADILFPAFFTAKGVAPRNITLVSTNGTVTISAGVNIGGGLASASARGNPAANGTNGGRIKIIGVNIDQQGKIVGNQGGASGSSNLTGVALPAAVSANGGIGGPIILCALESINLAAGSQAIAGKGGLGGNTSAIGAASSSATSGAGGDGGHVYFTGTGPGGAQMQIFAAANARSEGGKGGTGGVAMADAKSSGNGSAGVALSQGGRGGNGGTVNFMQSIVIRMGVFKAGDGGNGATATAVGGNRANSLFLAGGNGGNATAFGGNGRASGTVPQIPTQAGIQPGQAGTEGSGGNANATAGNGGNAGRFSITGGFSGNATAAGGLNGRGVPPPGGAPATAGPIGPAAGVAAPGPSVSQNGAP